MANLKRVKTKKDLESAIVQKIEDQSFEKDNFEIFNESLKENILKTDPIKKSFNELKVEDTEIKIEKSDKTLCRWINPTEPKHKILCYGKFYEFAEPDYTCVLPTFLADDYETGHRFIKKV